VIQLCNVNQQNAHVVN